MSVYSWDNLKQLQVGQPIEVVNTRLRALKGEFISYTDEAVSLRLGKQEQSVARQEVVRVSVRGASHCKRDMILGAAIGGGTVLAIGLLIDVPASNEGNGCAGCVVGFTATGAGGGLTLGALSRPEYRTIYRAKK